MAKPAALAAARRERDRRAGFDADERAKTRENLPVVIAGLTFRRRRKDWTVTRRMRQTMRAQEKAVAVSNRVASRISELEVEQIEAAAKGEEEREAELETTIGELVAKADEHTEAAELVTYRLLALLLVPPAAQAAEGEEAEPELRGFGPDDADDPELVDEAIGFLQPALDVEDAADLTRELTGSQEPDPPETPSSETGST